MDVLVALGLVPAGASKQQRARALAIARAPVPPGLRAIHPTWIEHGLAGLPERARAAVARGGGAGGAAGGGGAPVDVWLARWATAHLPSMIVEPALAARVARHRAWLLVDGIPTAPLPALVAWLAGLGQGGDDLARVRAGARVVAPRLSPLAVRQLAVRLPRPIGLVVHREVAPHCGADVGGTIPP
jgi:hypothetical protein